MTDNHMLDLARDAYREIEYEEWAEHGHLKDDHLLAWYRQTFYEEAEPEPVGSVF